VKKFIFILLLLFLLGSVGVMGALTDNIISYYKLGTDNATQPDSAGSNDATVIGATYTASGKDCDAG